MSAQEAAGFAWLLGELPKLVEGINARLERMEQVQRAFQVEVRERLDRIELRLPPAVLTRDQVADLLQVNVRTVDRWLDEGRLREVRVGKLRRVDATSIRCVDKPAELKQLLDDFALKR